MVSPREKFIQTLSHYVPTGLAPELVDWLLANKAMLRITKGRKSKFGDYRAPNGAHGHRISVNHDLNPYAFLVTLLHEMAHLDTWVQYEHRVQPHGAEWKASFRKILLPYLQGTVFPSDIQEALVGYLKNPAASSCTDAPLYKALRRYDAKFQQEGWVHLDDFTDRIFQIEDGRQFEKLEKLRKFYLCRLVGTQKKFRISPVAMVRPVEK